MPGDPEEDEINWFRPVWETEDQNDLDRVSRRRSQRPLSEPDFDHPLLIPLARAQDAVARLQAKTEAASEVVTEGLRARMSYLEASGWLRYAHIRIHPWDLALSDHRLTWGTFTGAALGRIRQAKMLPSTVAQEGELVLASSAVEALQLQFAIGQALRLARLWRRLGELRTWRPLADADAIGETLESLLRRRVSNDAIADWLSRFYLRDQGPDLLRAGRAAKNWECQAGVKERDPDGVFLGACLWHEKNRSAPIALPFWSAPEERHIRLGRKVGVPWMVEFLDCIAAAAATGMRELKRLQEAEDKGKTMGATARSRLPKAVDAVLRAHIVTTASLARAVDVTPQAALVLLRQLTAAGIVREATGRASSRAYALV